MRLENMVGEGRGHIAHLIWQHRLMILRTFLYLFMLFINRKLNMITWLYLLKSHTCVSNPSILHSVRNLQTKFQFTWNFHNILSFLINAQLFQSAQYFKAKLYITVFIKQLYTSDLTLNRVDNPSNVIFIFSSNLS